ncbi:penicillin-binding protein 1A (PBP-1a) (PBP1a) MrcA, putative [Candidatus Endolissoclinum faulkneri L5]|uniref:Penicillin-binding protein 1A n=1 Tax=Candidatus Endolissoclinum faulkneri L5 TaxID=1401328 RepID=V9TVZ0_9PROT|nr:penicillin-binding protein 1A [Candidatus Endolissoclinum faulkneri]AHC73495.1 penicillin-binding protein 1A (PBP-1a) (PBP1a) MrcA, putative [Candidatus Endolissoclinum faulkneri L5]
MLIAYIFYCFSQDLPDYKFLADYEPSVITRVHADDGSLLAEFAHSKRIFVPIEAIPKRVINAFLAAEDKNFYKHFGVDFFSLTYATFINIRNYGRSRRPVGASTITQQVAKNFLLSNEASIKRKIKEAILSFRIEHALSKDRILELYLNEIYLGFGSYGVATAALNYFNKTLAGLTYAEAAYLAALPKAPNNYHPIRKHDNAVARRNWVIKQMEKNNFISNSQAQKTIKKPLVVSTQTTINKSTGDYFADEVRRILLKRYGEKCLYEGGMLVFTTLNPKLQRIADKALRNGLIEYDQRHGWRSAIAKINIVPGWKNALAKVKKPPGLGCWRLGVVIKADNDNATIGFADGSFATMPYCEMKWARKRLKNQRFGMMPQSITEVLSIGDVVPVEIVKKNSYGKTYNKPTVALRQVPDVEGAILAMDPHTGKVLAMSGGYSSAISKFNRATQAWRQPGSSFKPFVYLAALENGYTPATQLLDAPLVLDQGSKLPPWKPSNYSNKSYKSSISYGLTPLRVGIEKSRNLMTIRLAESLGMDKVVQYAKLFGVVEHMEPHLSFALGAAETTLLRITSAYSMFVNGGKKIKPSLFNQIVNRYGKIIYRRDKRLCERCNIKTWDGGPPPKVHDNREQIIDPASAYQIVSMLKGVVQRGTGRAIASLDKTIAGKTGTTNNNLDCWFIGFSPDLAVGVFVGFDYPRTLGRNDTASSVAVPIFKLFMANALNNVVTPDFRIPPRIRMVWIDANSGRRINSSAPGAILEAFKPGTEPVDNYAIIDNKQIIISPAYPKQTEPTAAPIIGNGLGIY